MLTALLVGVTTSTSRVPGCTPATGRRLAMRDGMRRTAQITFIAISLGIGTGAYAQVSEWNAKIQEDLDFYKGQFVSKCKTAEEPAFRFVGKLEGNPRETRVSISCTQAVEAALESCDSSTFASKGKETPVVRALSKVKTVTCNLGSGPYNFRLSGGDLTFTVDAKYDDKKDKATQKDALIAKIKRELDR
jgi:hypothetical protein